MTAPTLLEVVRGGFTALLGPGYALPLLAVAGAGVLVAGRQPRRAALSGAVALALLVTALGARAGLLPSGTFAPLLALGPILIFVELVRRRPESVQWWLGAGTGLVTGLLALIWRVDRFGPVLSALRGAWQSDPSRTDLALYHSASGLGLAVVYLFASELGRILGDRRLRELRWIVWVGVLLLILTQRIGAISHWLLLKWPAWRVG